MLSRKKSVHLLKVCRISVFRCFTSSRPRAPAVVIASHFSTRGLRSTRYHAGDGPYMSPLDRHVRNHMAQMKRSIPVVDLQMLENPPMPNPFPHVLLPNPQTLFTSILSRNPSLKRWMQQSDQVAVESRGWGAGGP